MKRIISNVFNKRLYKKVYGNKAKVNIGEDFTEVSIGNRKIIHETDTGKKIEETIYDSNEVRVVKYDSEGCIEKEEIYINGEKVTEIDVNKGKSTNLKIDDEGMEILDSKYEEDGVDVKEKTYKYRNKITDEEYSVIILEKDNAVFKNMMKKDKEGNILEVEQKSFSDGRLLFYKNSDLEIEIEYFQDTGKVKRYSKHYEEPVYEEVAPSKSKKGSKNEVSKVEKKIIGTKIIKEILNLNQNSNIIGLEKNDSFIKRDFDDKGSLKRQYKIIMSDKGKEIVGKLITEDGEIKIINNSMLSNELIVKINEEMDGLEESYESNFVKLYNFIIHDNGIELSEDTYLISKKVELVGRVYDRLEDNVPYRIEETYKNGKLFSKKKINKISKTELYSEGETRVVKCINGVEKEVTLEEFEMYKMADELNKI